MPSNDPDQRPARDESGFAPEFQVVLDTGRRLAETLNLPDILQAAVDGITSLVGFDTAAVYLVAGDDLNLGATYPPLPADFPDHLRLAPLADHPHIAESIRTHACVMVDDLLREARTEAEREVAAKRSLRSVLYVPMVVERDAIGAFIVGSTAGVVQISANRVGLAEALANLSALAARNAMLFEKVQTRSAELQQALAEMMKMQEERESLQAQLSQAQKLESIGRLAGGVAHDFNNMLHVIQGYTELAMDAVPEESEARDNLTEVRQAAERSTEITRKLLAFARKQAIAPEIIDLNEAVGSMLRMLGRLLGEDLELLWAPAPEPVKVLLDSSQLDQILANLCVNARDAVEGIGKVTIETAAVSLDAEYCAGHPDLRPGSYGVLSVSDTGCGMDAETRQKLFDPFFTTKQDGTGLGLAMVYGIVRQNEGFVHVYSEPGDGTTFRIYLPLQAGAAVSPVRRGAAPPLAGEETVLVVEDNAAIRNLAATMLASLGYDVITAESSTRAEAVAAGHPRRLQLLLTDVVMPGLNGRELARRLADVYPGLKVLFISGYTADVIAHRGVLDAGVQFIQKPFTREQLAARVRQVLDGGPTAGYGSR